MAAYQLLTTWDSPNYTPHAAVPRVYGAPRVITGITVHHWGALGQAFDNVRRYLCRDEGDTSAHEVIEAGRVAVIVNHRDAAWHAGSATGNRTTIGLELRPEATPGDYATAAERIADLRETYGDLPLYPHRHWKATACPGRWDLAKLDRLAREVAARRRAPTTAEAAPAPAPATPTPEDDTMHDLLLIRNRESGATILRVGDGRMNVKDTAELQSYRDAGVPKVDVDPASFVSWHERLS